jgi:hypothetical protein
MTMTTTAAAGAEPADNRPDRFLRGATILLFAGAGVWAAVHVIFARVFGDEGWYLNAARELLRGRWPYLDFFYPQGPGLVFVHVPVMSVAPGILASRCQSFVLFVASLLIGCLLLGRENRAAGAPWWLALVGAHALIVNLSTLVVSTPYELFLVLMALWLVQRDRREAAMAVLATGACLRVSLSVLVILWWVFGVATAARGERTRTAWRLLACAGMPPLLLVGPFLLFAPERVLDGVLFYHVWGGRAVVSAVQAWHHRFLFWLDLVNVFWPSLALAIFGWWRTRRLAWDSLDALLLGGALVLTAVHSLPATPDPRYHVVPVALVSLFAARRLAATRLPRWAFVAVLVGVVAWETSSYTLRWAHLSQDLRAPHKFHRVARQIGALAGGQPVLTFETALAVEGDFAVPRGYELGFFSVTPAADEQRAARDGLVTPSHLLRDLAEARYPVVAFYEDDLGYLSAGDRRQADGFLHRAYRLVAKFPRLGQLRQDLFVFVRSPQPLSEPAISPPTK